jgi:hypothetical protein
VLVHGGGERRKLGRRQLGANAAARASKRREERVDEAFGSDKLRKKGEKKKKNGSVF